MLCNKFKFAGIEIDNVSLEELLKRIENMLINNEKGYVVTPNAWHLVLLQKDKEFKKAYENAEVIVPDGASLILISKFLNTALKERITGSDLLYSLLDLAEKKGYRVYLLGAEKEIIQKAYSMLKLKFPKAKIINFHNGYFTDDDEIVKKINALEPDIVFIGMGSPKQEKWIYKNINKLKIGIAVCIGGVFDVIAGKVKRAPKWIQKIGLEWFWRLIQEPKRLWKRYLIGNTIFIFLVLEEVIKKFLGEEK